jgi:hypothetical protein
LYSLSPISFVQARLVVRYTRSDAVTHQPPRLHEGDGIGLQPVQITPPHLKREFTYSIRRLTRRILQTPLNHSLQRTR